jgi:hypothetical protein
MSPTFYRRSITVTLAVAVTDLAYRVFMRAPLRRALGIEVKRNDPQMRRRACGGPPDRAMAHDAMSTPCESSVTKPLPVRATSY